MPQKEKKLWMYSVGRLLMQLPVRMFYRITISGTEYIPGPEARGFILAANHISVMDPIMLGLIMKRQVRFMAKEELFHNRFFGWIMRQIGAFPVARGKGDMGAVGHGINLVEEGHILGIFPEGTCSKTGQLLRPKSGVIVIAAATGGDILPASITAFPDRLLHRRHVHIAFGEMIANESLSLTGPHDLSRIKAASKLLMGRIASLRQKTLDMEGTGKKDEA